MSNGNGNGSQTTKVLTREFIFGFALQLLIVCGGGLIAFTNLKADVEAHADKEHVPPERIARIEENTKTLVKQVDQIAAQQKEFAKVIAKLEVYLEVEAADRRNGGD